MTQICIALKKPDLISRHFDFYNFICVFCRFEQEKETSFKELQKQSIEYEKKLQDQLEEKNQELDNLKALLKRFKAERKNLKEAHEKELSLLTSKLSSVTELLNEKEQERINLDEKREMLETILNDKDKTFKVLEAEIGGLTAEKTALQEEKAALTAEKAALTAEKTALEGDVNFFRGEKQLVESQLSSCSEEQKGQLRRLDELADSLQSAQAHNISLEKELRTAIEASRAAEAEVREYKERLAGQTLEISQLTERLASKEDDLEKTRYVGGS